MGYALYNRFAVSFTHTCFVIDAFGILGKGIWGGTPVIKTVSEWEEYSGWDMRSV